MEFFTGNPFSSAVGQRVEQATSSSLPSEDWSLNMEICDLVNESEDGPKDAVRALKKRILGNKNPREVMLALSVLEACVKNCGHKFHVYVSTRDFVENVLVQSVLPKNNPPVILQDRVLSMIQAWSDAFRSSPDLTGVVTVYEDLRRKGLEFPMTELNGYSPIHTPGKAVESVQTDRQTLLTPPPAAVDTPITLTTHQMRTLNTELEVVKNNLSVMSDMMSQMEPSSLERADTDLLQQLYSISKEMQGRMVDLIPRLSDEKLIETLLKTNDHINSTFTRYHRFERHMIKHSGVSVPADVNFTDMGVVSDASTNSSSSQSAVCALSNQMSGLSTKTEADTSSSVCETSGGWAAQEGGAQEVGVADSGDPASFSNCPHFHWMVSKGMIPVTQNDMMDDIERWLEEEELQDDDTEGVTSEEFDKFLAERAKAADRLPSLERTHP